jgi:hypothetical protein
MLREKAQVAKTARLIVPMRRLERMVYRITMGVRSSDQNWKRQLNKLIVENQPAINKILLDFNVPLLDGNDRLIAGDSSMQK